MMKPKLSVLSGLLTCLLVVSVPGLPIGAEEAARDDSGGISGLTAADSLNMREEPSLSAPVVARLPWGSQVSIHTNTYRPVEIEGRPERWVFVSAVYCPVGTGCYTREASGWVIDSYLATGDRFEPMSAWRPGELGDVVGDSGGTYRIAADGSFTHLEAPCWDGNCGENREHDVCPEGVRREGIYCVVSGQLYRYRNLVQAVQADGSTHGYLYVDGFGALCSVSTWIWYGERSCDR